jgi:hypothetical protein
VPREETASADLKEPNVVLIALARRQWAASASHMGRFETEWLTRPVNLAALGDLPGRWTDAVHERRQPKVIVLDMDASDNPTYGEQEGSAYNGHLSNGKQSGPRIGMEKGPLTGIGAGLSR